MLQGQEVPGQVFPNRGEILTSPGPFVPNLRLPELLADVTGPIRRARSHCTVRVG